MMPFAVHIVWAAFAAIGLLLPGGRERLTRLAIVLSLLLPLSFLAGTHSGGSDFTNYYRWFQRFRTFEDVRVDFYPEFGFQALLAVGNILSLPYGAVFTAIALTAFVLIVVAVRRFGENEALYFFLYIPKYFYQGNISQIRSSILYPFVLLAGGWLAEGLWIRVVLAGLALSLIHSSAILLCLLPLFQKVRLNQRFAAAMFVLPVAFSFIGPSLLTELWNTTGIRQFGYVAAQYETIPLISLEVLRRAGLYLMLVILIRRGKTDDPAMEWVGKIFLLGWAFYVGFLEVRVISDRVGALFGVVEPLVLLTFSRVLIPRERLLWSILVVMLGVAEFALRAVVYGDVPFYIPYWRQVVV